MNKMSPDRNRPDQNGSDRTGSYRNGSDRNGRTEMSCAVGGNIHLENLTINFG